MRKGVIGIGVVIVAATTAVVLAEPQRQTEAEQVKARQRISMMEGMFERAVQNGADNLLRQVRQVTPLADGFMLTGAPHVRGFRLDNFGVFFDVEVPALRPPVAWTLRYMVDQNGIAASSALADLAALVDSVPDQRQRSRLEQSLRRIEAQVGPAQRVSPRPGAQQTVTAQSVGQANVAAPQSTQTIDPVVISDPTEAYTREVQVALVDAMLENSGPMGIGPEEWLAVAARDNAPTDRLAPTDATDLHTIMFRVKGSDLAAFHERKISLDEARKRVEVREY